MIVGSNCYEVVGKLIKVINFGLVVFDFFCNFFIDVFFEEFCFLLYKKFFFCGKYVLYDVKYLEVYKNLGVLYVVYFDVVRLK